MNLYPARLEELVQLQEPRVVVAGAVEKCGKPALVVLNFEIGLLEIVRADEVATQSRVQTGAIQQVDEILVVLPVPGNPKVDFRTTSGNGIHVPSLCWSM